MKEVYKKKKPPEKVALFVFLGGEVGVDGFEPPTLCL